MAPNNFRRVMQWLFGGARAAWLVVGATVFLLLILEAGYRLSRATSRLVRPAHAAGTTRLDHPYHDQAWFDHWAGWRDEVLRDSTRYDPYRGWRLPAVSFPGLHIDSSGRRLTPQAPAAAGPNRQVFFLGGSTMWGYTARDSSTIPTLVARHLAARGVRDVTMVNLAAMGYNATQAAITLMLELRRGNVPSLVVAMDGVNEAGPLEEGGGAGDVYRQRLLAERFEGKGLLRDLLVHFTFLNRLLLLRSGATGSTGDVDANCAVVSRYYANLTREMEVIAAANGFPILFLWQPTLVRSRKRRTEWEHSLAGQRTLLQQLTSVCGARTAGEMRGRADSNYASLDGIFDADTESVFLDHWGHVTERANDVIAARIADLIYPLLESARPKDGGTRSAPDT